MSHTANQGVSGQNITISGQNVAVGANSHIEQNISGGTFNAPLADLRAAIEAFDGPPETRQALIAAQAEVAGELESPAPSKDKLLAKLASLKELAGPAAGVAQAVTALVQVIATAF
jgi:hypothetical protein